MRAWIKMATMWLEKQICETVDTDGIGHGNCSEMDGEQKWAG